ncbi:MAG: NADH-quinone oxidoreductase subunit N [Candidatus Odinarchaeota archaeon]
MQLSELFTLLLNLLANPFLPFAIFAALGLITPVINRLFRRKSAAYWALLNIIFLAALIVPQWTVVISAPIFSLTLWLDGIGLFFVTLFIIVGFVVVIASADYFENNPNQATYYTLLQFALLGMMLVAMAVDLIVMFTGWILVAITTYTMVVIRKDDPKGIEAGVKYLIVGAVSSAAILLGISMIFGLTGSTRLVDIATMWATLNPEFIPLAVLGVLLLIAGFGFKMGIVPFHMWLPDTYEGAPQPVTAFLGGSSNKAAFAAIIRVFILGLMIFRFQWATAFAFLALITMTWGNIAALSQKTLTRLLAYSAIAQAGYAIIGLAAPTVLGISGLMFHALNDGLTKTGAFIAATAIALVLSSTKLSDINGLGKRMPTTALTLSILLLALAGVPPLSGFFSKLVLFTAAVEANLVWLAIAGVLNSAFSLAYYGWIIKRMYFDEIEEGSVETATRESRKFKFVLVFLAALTIAIGIFSGIILGYIEILVIGFLPSP